MKRRAALLALLPLCPALGAEARRYTVCEVLSHLERLHGRVVTVKARLSFGLGTWLRSDHCSLPFKVGQYTFDDLIAVEWPDSVIVEYELKGEKLFPPDTHGSELVAAAATVYPEGTEFLATIEGMIVTRLPRARLVHSRAPTTPLGFGHLGMAPAMIVVKRVIELKALEKAGGH